MGHRQDERLESRDADDDRSECTTLPPPTLELPFESRVPVVVASVEGLAQAGLDSRAGFLLSLMDGSTSIELLLDLCGMPDNEALLLLNGLRRQGLVTLR
jgi:hypothetical protein